MSWISNLWFLLESGNGTSSHAPFSRWSISVTSPGRMARERVSATSVWVSSCHPRNPES